MHRGLIKFLFKKNLYSRRKKHQILIFYSFCGADTTITIQFINSLTLQQF